jgi:rhodanese-related sulfurtransferase
MILHMRSAGRSRNYQHWIAYLGVEDGNASVLDAPHPIETVSFAKLLANWDGMALAVSTAPIPNAPIHMAWLDYALKAIALICFVCLIRLSALGKRELPLQQTARQRLSRLGVQMAALVGLTVAIGLAYHTWADVGFMRNSAAVAEVTRRYHSADFPECSITDMKQFVERGDRLIVDARYARAFQLGAIPDAVNIPVDSTLAQRQRVLRGVAPDSPIVVYCQSPGCQYADEVAEFLKFNGYSNISLYPGGYREWSQQFPPREKAEPSAESEPEAQGVNG